MATNLTSYTRDQSHTARRLRSVGAPSLIDSVALRHVFRKEHITVRVLRGLSHVGVACSICTAHIARVRVYVAGAFIHNPTEDGVKWSSRDAAAGADWLPCVHI